MANVIDMEYLRMAGVRAADIVQFERRGANVRSPYSYADYAEDEELQEVVSLLKLDADKFWALMLFAYDFSDDVCNHGVEIEEGGHEMMWMLIDRGRQLIAGETPAPVKTDAMLKIRIQGNTYAIRDVDSLSILLYWIHRGMIQMSPNDTIWELNWLINDFTRHERPAQVSASVRIWVFARILLDFFKANSQFAGRAPRDSGISLNKQLLVSKMIYNFKLSYNDSFLCSDETLKGFLRQYRNQTMPSRGRYYGGGVSEV